MRLDFRLGRSRVGRGTTLSLSTMPVKAPPPRTASQRSSRGEDRLELRWPPQVRRTPARMVWFQRLGAVPSGLDLSALAQALGTAYSTARRWAFLFGYPITDRRCRGPRDKWNSIDWKLSDSQIARNLGVTRERVRQVRKQQGLPPSTGRHRRAIAAATPPSNGGLPIAETRRRAI